MHFHPVLGAKGRKAVWSAAGHSSNTVRLPHHIIWRQLIELPDIHGVCPPSLGMCPRPLQIGKKYYYENERPHITFTYVPDGCIRESLSWAYRPRTRRKGRARTGCDR